MRFHYALVTFLLALSSAERIAGRDGLHIRQDSNAAATTTNAPASSTTSGDNPSSTPTPTDPASTTNSNQDQSTNTAARTGDATSKATKTGTAAGVPTSTATNSPGGQNATSAETPNPLPIQPKLNAPLGVAGVVLMLAGLALAFIGIKLPNVQIFISTSLLVALGVEVLIVYLMKPPVPVAIQGAYLAAGVLGGVLVGSAALLFTDISEGFGCILGGFCFAMWLLVLTPGGLIQNSAGKIILIAISSITCYCLYISRYTRVYGAIFATSFAGSTAFVLGLDCFSRAGLKEFWLYIWNLNGNIFPLSTDTYPITRPLRAEVASIIIIAFLGSMSQIKIWRLVRERREKRDAQRIQDEEARDALEEQIGRRIEAENRDTLAHWEHEYDGKKMPEVQIHDSGVGSIDEDYTSMTGSHKLKSYPLVEIRHQTSDLSLSTARPSSSTANLLPREGLRTVPSVAGLGLDFGLARNDETTDEASFDPANVPIPSSPATPGLDVPGESTKDRRSVASKQISLQSLNAKAASETAENEEVRAPPEEESVIGSSVGATAPDGKSDKLSIQLDSELDKLSSPPTPEMEFEEPLVEVDDDALAPRKRKSVRSLLSVRGRRSSDALPIAGNEKKSDAGSTIGAAETKPDLMERLPKKASRVVRNHRTRLWAMEVSRAEPEPIQELDLEDPDAIRVQLGDAAEAARAEENNAAPAPTTPPPPPPLPVIAKDRKLSTHADPTSPTLPTAIYARKRNASQDSWAEPLGMRSSSAQILRHEPSLSPLAMRNVKRSSSAQLLRFEPGSTPLDALRNASTPILEHSDESAPSRDNRVSYLPGLPNLLDERRQRLDNRLTSTSFMRPSTAQSTNTPQRTTSTYSKEGSGEGSESGRFSMMGDSGMDPEDMTLTERRALVKQQSQLSLRDADMAARPLQASGYGFAQTTPPNPVRMSSQGQMQAIYDSHQPRHMSSHDLSKQAQNWNTWRASQQVAAPSRNPYMINDSQQDMLRAMRVQTENEAKLREQQKQALQEQIDAHARMGGLNDAHARALSKMQSQANKNAK